MKKVALFVAGLTFALPIVASASSFVITPSSGTYHVGDTITLNVSVNPAGSTIYTATMDARFSSGTVQVSLFTLNDSLLPLKQSGYDALDNTNGILTKTGGYTGGISSTAPFGVIVLQVKSAGTGTFTIVNTSKLLDSSNANQHGASESASFNIIAAISPAPTVTSTQTTSRPKPQQQQKSPAVSTKTTNTATASSATGTAATSSQSAAAAASGMGASLLWILGILAAFAVFGLGYFTGARQSR